MLAKKLTQIIVMRIDKFLKVARIIKRRTVANDAADNGRISVNGKVVKPSYEVEIRFGNNTSKFKITAIPKGQNCNSSDVIELL